VSTFNYYSRIRTKNNLSNSKSTVSYLNEKATQNRAT
jgi:hypothetical protein